MSGDVNVAVLKKNKLVDAESTRNSVSKKLSVVFFRAFPQRIERIVERDGPILSSPDFQINPVRWACSTAEAQSIGEPATQMTLKTFHFAGVVGLPRIWLGVSKYWLGKSANTKFPPIFGHLNEGISMILWGGSLFSDTSMACSATLKC